MRGTHTTFLSPSLFTLEDVLCSTYHTSCREFTAKLFTLIISDVATRFSICNKVVKLVEKPFISWNIQHNSVICSQLRGTMDSTRHIVRSYI